MGLLEPNHPVRRRHVVLGALAAAVLAPARAGEIRTPYELAQMFRSEVGQRLDVPRSEALLYGSMTEIQLPEGWQEARAPQYLLAVDKNPNIQAAFLFWRLMPGHYELVGAAPVSTGTLPAQETPDGVFERTPATGARELEFITRRPSFIAGRMQQREVRLSARAADASSIRRLGEARSDGCVLMPPSMLAFVDRHGVLDSQRPLRNLPYPGRLMVVIDSERADRPDWCVA